jgi:hypothetical protein
LRPLHNVRDAGQIAPLFRHQQGAEAPTLIPTRRRLTSWQQTHQYGLFQSASESGCGQAAACSKANFNGGWDTMPYVMGGNHLETVQIHPASRVVPELAGQRTERERRAAAESQPPCGGFMLGGNSGYMLGSGN